ncbi:hypothetical protein [Marinicellulosiphila megalodicopiae]|uniref:hypothetical protein n=1 Tax=Marinicellulosiphila megalodicopiae TaxID=2724896 RepID=UPI003BAF3206
METIIDSEASQNSTQNEEFSKLKIRLKQVLTLDHQIQSKQQSDSFKFKLEKDIGRIQKSKSLKHIWAVKEQNHELQQESVQECLES